MSESKAFGEFWTSVYAAFSSWWGLLGILAASVTGFNLIRKVVHLRLAELIANIFKAYQEWVHVPVQWLFGWLHLPVPPSWVIDLALPWLLVGGIVLRSAWPIRVAAIRERKEVYSHSNFWNMLLENRGAFTPFVVFCLIAWPIATLFLLGEPYLHRAKSISAGGPELLVPWARRRLGLTYLYDLRIVLATQALAAVACIVAWGVLNVVLLG